jgi:hypothetical protein
MKVWDAKELDKGTPRTLANVLRAVADWIDAEQGSAKIDGLALVLHDITTETGPRAVTAYYSYVGLPKESDTP